LDAFRSCGPLIDVPEVDRLREAAASRLLKELGSLAHRLRGFSPSIRDDAVQVVIVRLFKAGPRGTRHGDPESDDAVRAYLLTALRNAARDLLPHPSLREFSPEVERKLTGSDPRPDAQFEELTQRTGARNLLAAAQARLAEVVRLAGEDLGGPARERFLVTVGELTDVADGRLTFARLVEEEMAGSGASLAVAKNRLYKRYSRALDRIVETIERLASDGTVSPAEGQALLGALDGLRLRPDTGR
jgi:DNA-directed RNA polymerase specialized sigma24 family protein